MWADTFVTDDALLKRMKDLRAALDDERRQYIKTVPRRGYLFTADVKEVGDGPEASVEEVPKAVERIGASRRRWSPAALTVVAVSIVAVLAIVGLYEYRTRRASVAEASQPIRSIAVLPLKDLTGDPSNEYFSDGMTESLISALTRVEDLKVSSRGSVMRFKGADADPGDVGRQLGVAAVLEGSMRRSADGVRIGGTARQRGRRPRALGSRRARADAERHLRPAGRDRPWCGRGAETEPQRRRRTAAGQEAHRQPRGLSGVFEGAVLLEQAHGGRPAERPRIFPTGH